MGVLLIVILGVVLSLIGFGMIKLNLLKSKTAWTAVVGFLTAFVTFATGKLNLAGLIMAFVGMLITLFLRSEIEINLRNWLNKFQWWSSKTFWAAVSEALGVITLYLAGKIELSGMLLGVFAALITIFLRSAASKIPIPRTG